MVRLDDKCYLYYRLLISILSTCSGERLNQARWIHIISSILISSQINVIQHTRIIQLPVCKKKSGAYNNHAYLRQFAKTSER
jgi:hypothetical protein